MAKLRNDWFCTGCKKLHHRHQRDIEGSNNAGYWCAASIVKGIAERRNDLPEYDLVLAARGQSLARRSAIAA